MSKTSRVLLELPSDDEMMLSEEIRTAGNDKLLKKTIRYQNGIVVVLILDFQNKVFSVLLKPTEVPFALRGKQIVTFE